MKTTAIVLSAGRGTRMNSDVAKQYLPLKGRPVLFYCMDIFQKSFIDEIVLVCAEEDIEYCKTEIVDKFGFSKVSKIVSGGKERYNSVYNGLCAIEDDAELNNEERYVFIHDGARPFVDIDMLNRVLEEVRIHKACITGVPVKDTIKVSDKEGFVCDTPNRSSLYQVQTPQVFEYKLIKDAYKEVLENEKKLREQGISITDDAMIVEAVSDTKVKIVEGSYRNIKITTPEDMIVAASFIG